MRIFSGLGMVPVLAGAAPIALGRHAVKALHQTRPSRNPPGAANAQGRRQKIQKEGEENLWRMWLFWGRASAARSWPTS